MYNGIGLSTVRGTATSGHVQRNASHVHASRRRTQTSRHVAGHRTGPQLVSAAAQSRGNREIQDHADRRRLENRLLVLREEWEARGVAEAEIVARLATERAASVASRNESAEATESVVLSPDTRSSVRSGVPGHLTRACRRDAVATTNTHVQKQAKAVENERLAAAFGISHVRHQEGAAFDRELQQAKKQERLARLEEERRVVEKAARKREKELRNAQKEVQRKQAKRKDDDSRSFYSSDDSRSSRIGVGVVAESARTVEAAAAAAQSAGLRRDENERGRFLQSLRKKRKRNDQFLQRADRRCHRHIGLNADRALHLGHRHRNDLEAGQRHILEAHRVRDLVRLHGLDPDHDCEMLETDPEVDHIRDPHPVLVPDHREDGPELGRVARVIPRTFHEKWRPKIGGLLPGVPYLLASAGPDTRPALPPIRPDRTVVARPVDH